MEGNHDWLAQVTKWLASGPLPLRSRAVSSSPNVLSATLPVRTSASSCATVLAGRGTRSKRHSITPGLGRSRSVPWWPTISMSSPRFFGSMSAALTGSAVTLPRDQLAVACIDALSRRPSCTALVIKRRKYACSSSRSRIWAGNFIAVTNASYSSGSSRQRQYQCQCQYGLMGCGSALFEMSSAPKSVCILFKISTSLPPSFCHSFNLQRTETVARRSGAKRDAVTAHTHTRPNAINKGWTPGVEGTWAHKVSMGPKWQKAMRSTTRLRQSNSTASTSCGLTQAMATVFRSSQPAQRQRHVVSCTGRPASDRSQRRSRV